MCELGTKKRGSQGKTKSYVKSHPTHLLSGSLKCGTCGGAIALVSGKGSGYYGCTNASRKSCDNKVLISRKRLEKKLLAALHDEVLQLEVLDAVYKRTAEKVKEQFAHVPEQLRLKKIELNRAEARVHNFIEFIASGRATPSLADALSQAEEQVKTLSADAASLEEAKDHAFTPPPKAWIESRVAELTDLLEQRTERSALAFRRLAGPVVLTPKKPDIGKAYYQASCRVDALNLLACEGADEGSSLLRWWRGVCSNVTPHAPAPSRSATPMLARRLVALLLVTRRAYHSASRLRGDPPDERRRRPERQAA